MAGYGYGYFKGGVPIGSNVNQFLPLQLIKSPDVYTDEMETLTGWTVAGTDAVVEVNTTQVHSGTGSLKVTSGINKDVTITKAVNWNFSDAGESFRLWAYPHSAVPKFTVFFSGDSGFANYFKFSYPLKPEYGYKLNDWNLMNELIGFITVGTPSWSDIKYFRIKIDRTAEQSNSISFDLLQQGRVRTPAIVMSFDGSYNNYYDIVYPLMKARRMKGTIYATSNVGSQSNLITSAQFQEMNADGWDIANHGATHPNFATLTKAQVIEELQLCEDWLLSMGLSRASKHVAYPYAQYNNTTLEAMSDFGAKTGRSAFKGTYNKYIGNYDDNRIYELASFTYTTTPISTAEQYLARIDDFIAHNQIPNCYFHVIGEDWPLENFIAVLDGIEARGLQTLTIDEYYRLYSEPITVNHK